MKISSSFSLFRASCRIRTNDPEITNHVLWPTELKRRGWVSLLYRAATTNYLCCDQALEDSSGAGRIGLTLWAFKFMLFPLGLRIPFLQLLFIVLTIGVPFLGYIFAKKFRERHCDGSITFSRAFLFTTFMYMFASLFVAVVHYIYFRYIDGGFVFEAYRSILNQFKETAGAELTTSLNQFEEAIDLLSGLTPLEMTFQLISQNMFYGMLMAIPTALIVMRKKKNE